MSKKNLIQVANLSELEIVKFILTLLIYGLINTKEKRREKLTAFFTGFLYKKRPLRRERRGQLGKKLICTPLRSGTKPSRNVKALLASFLLFPLCYI